MADKLIQGATAKSLALSRIMYFESQMHRRMGLVRPMRYIRLWNYYASTNLPPDNVEQPLSVNYFKAICDKHTGFLWGEYDESLIDWSVRPKDRATPEDDISITIRRYLEQLLWDNDGNILLWDASLNASVYGDAVLRLRWDLTEDRVVIENLLPEYFHCRWDTANMRKMTEVIVAYPIDRLDAYERYGTYGNPSINYNIINPQYMPGMGVYWEHWTTKTYQIWIDDMLVRNEPNPYMWQDQAGNVYPGVIPFVHIPNMRMGGEYYGFGDAESIMLIQDEINRRLGDQGDIVNNHAHPIVVVKNFHGDQEDLPVGPDAVWNLGLNGEADILEAKGNPMAMEYLQQIMMNMLDTSGMPEVAFGRQSRSNGRAQSSATALQLIMMPVVERAKRKRIQWSDGLKKMVHIAMFIQEVYKPGSMGFHLSDINNYLIAPQFASILPRDRLQSVNENVALVINGLRPLARALEDLGEQDISEQINSIVKEAEWRAGLEQTLGGQNSDQGQGGSPNVPGGPGAKTKPGSPVKSAGDASSNARGYAAIEQFDH